ncbi:hypothetical protein T02_8934 [Trichinella nativa]|uniref:Uncharacterized protein n=1 Tax=Trichinella nativa TaxID=6335 RepID=A0A0V1KT84_9BILA|nr:hypothetical protein T02_8934 [Trichinella nativa]
MEVLNRIDESNCDSSLTRFHEARTQTWWSKEKYTTTGQGNFELRIGNCCMSYEINEFSSSQLKSEFEVTRLLTTESLKVYARTSRTMNR